MSKAGIPAYKGKKTTPAKPKGCKAPAAKGPRPASTAGWYLCNWMTYLLPKYAKENKLDMDVGFIHLPTRPEYAAKDPEDPDWSAAVSTRTSALAEQVPVASMSIDQTLQGIRIALEECVRARAEERPAHAP
jgi:pyrrolidone-carboxylate peptidase